MIDPASVAVGLIPTIGMLLRKWLVYMQRESRAQADVEIKKLEVAQTENGRLWERIGQLDQQIKELMKKVDEQAKQLVDQAVTIVTLKNQLADRDAIIADQEHQLQQYRQGKGVRSATGSF